MPQIKLETIPADSIANDPYGISTFEGYSAIPLTNGSNPNLLVLTDEKGEQYVMGFVKKAGLIGDTKIIKNNFYEVYGTTHNDLYNNIDDVTDLGVATKRSREVVKARSVYLGDTFASGTAGTYDGFESEFYLNVDIVADGTVPIAIDPLSEAYLVMAEGGGKYYLATSGTVHEAEGYRVAVGTRTTQIVSHDVWTPATLKATTVEDAMTNIAGTLTKVGARDVFPLANTYHVYNIEDDAGLFMGSGAVEMYNWGASDTEFSHTIWDDDGVHIDVDAARKINISVGGVAGTSIIIEDGKITLLATDFEWTGNLHVTGTLIVDQATTLKAAVDAQATLDVTGLITGIGGADIV